jgi:hypothetical protein
LGHLNFGDSNLPFGLAQGGESFDFAQDREPVENPELVEVVERLVEPFRISANFIRSGEFRISGLSGLGY